MDSGQSSTALRLPAGSTTSGGIDPRLRMSPWEHTLRNRVSRGIVSLPVKITTRDNRRPAAGGGPRISEFGRGRPCPRKAPSACGGIRSIPSSRLGRGRRGMCSRNTLRSGMPSGTQITRHPTTAKMSKTNLSGVYSWSCFGVAVEPSWSGERRSATPVVAGGNHLYLSIITDMLGQAPCTLGGFMRFTIDMRKVHGHFTGEF